MLLFISGCVQVPFVDARREAGSPYTVGESKPDRVAICYNPYSTNADEIMKMAQEENFSKYWCIHASILSSRIFPSP